MKDYSTIQSIPSLHSSSPAGINSIAVSSANPSQFLTGGNDKIVQLYDRAEGKVVATLKGHTKKVHSVLFREKEGENTLVISGSADKTVRVWSHDAPSGQYAPQTTVKTHKGEITGIVVQPSGKYLAIGSQDGSWSLQNLETSQTLYHSPRGGEPYTSIGLHPDGCLLALGTASSAMQIYDIRVQAFVASLAPENATPFTVNTVSFSENGYHLAAPGSSSSVAIWDLRKQKLTQDIALEADFKINKIRYDVSAQWLGVAGNADLRLIAHKTWDQFAKLDQGNDIADFAFGPRAQEIWTVSGREVKILGSA